MSTAPPPACLNAPTGAWCSLTHAEARVGVQANRSQCTYRCVVLPDRAIDGWDNPAIKSSQCTCRCVVLPD